MKNVKYKLDSPPSSASNQKAARSRHGQPLTVFSQYFTISDNYLEYSDNHVYSVYLYIVLISFTIFIQSKGSAAAKTNTSLLHVHMFTISFNIGRLFRHWQMFFAIPPHCTLSSPKVKSNAFLLNILVPGFQQNVTSGKCSGKSWKLMFSRWIKWNCDIKSGFVGFLSFRAHSQL